MDAVPPHTFSQKGVYYQEQQLEAELAMGCKAACTCTLWACYGSLNPLLT